MRPIQPLYVLQRLNLDCTDTEYYAASFDEEELFTDNKQHAFLFDTLKNALRIREAFDDVEIRVLATPEEQAEFRGEDENIDEK